MYLARFHTGRRARERESTLRGGGLRLAAYTYVTRTVGTAAASASSAAPYSTVVAVTTVTTAGSHCYWWPGGPVNYCSFVR